MKPDSIVDWTVKWACCTKEKEKEKIRSTYPLVASNGHREEKETDTNR